MRVAAKIIGLAIGGLSIGVACAAPTTFETTRAAALRARRETIEESSPARRRAKRRRIG